MMKLTPLGWPDLHGLTADVDERTQEHEEREEHTKNARTQEHKHDTKTRFPHRSVQAGPIESQRERLASRYKEGSWMVVSLSVNRTDPIESPADERLASS